jgi:hypothetical protein
MNAVATLALLLAVAPPMPPKAKITLGQDTTFLDGAVDADGWFDFETALNAKLGDGITAKTNALVLLWQATGERGDAMPLDYWKALGTTAPPLKADFLMAPSLYASEVLKLEGQAFADFNESTENFASQPWSAKENPIAAEAIRYNGPALALALEASKREHYFNPAIAARTPMGRGALITSVLHGVQHQRHLASVLLTRAMMKLDAGEYDSSWDDLLALHRLARLSSRGATTIEGLVSIAIEAMTIGAELQWLAKAPLEAKQHRERAAQIAGLPEAHTLAMRMDLGERIVFLDSVQTMAKNGTVANTDAVLRIGNATFTRIAKGLGGKERHECKASLAALEKELAATAKNPQNVDEALASQLLKQHMPALVKMMDAQDRSRQMNRNLQIAFALAAHRAEHAKYPEKLDALKDLPLDLFSGKPVNYRVTATGYFLSSVGPNGLDDETPEKGDGAKVAMPPLRK